MVDEPPVVAVWRDLGSQWARVGEIGEYNDLKFTPTFNDVGDWTTTLPYEDQALLLTKNRLVTIDWRGVRSTWQVVGFNPSSDEETGETVLAVSGGGALARLGWVLAWPNPALPIGSQPVVGEEDPAPYVGPAETVIRTLVAGNLRDRYGMAITCPPSQGRGTTVTARPVFDNLLELVTKLAKDGGIGVDVGLVDVAESATRANLTLRFWTPVNRAKSVLLTAAAGTLDKWEQADTAPTATKALVGGAGNGGADRFFTWPVTTPKSTATASEWGGHREVFVDGPATFDPAELQQAGRQALTEGAETRTLALTSAESEGQQAFRHFAVGDIATGEVLTGASVQDVITSIAVTVDENGIDVVPTFGNPSATDATLDLAEQVGALRRALRYQERK
ncbi:MAG TPA: hypothetical protein VF642_12240 [Propionibacteriaceae bacterium]|jgi:hypothetical protein